MIDGDISTMEAEELEQIEDNNKKFLYARVVHANHKIQHPMHEILEHRRVFNEYRAMADGERDMIPLELEQYKKDSVINQHIMQMINADIFWYRKTFRAILMELQKIWNGETIVQSSEELSEDAIHHCDERHATFDDQRLYKGEKTQQDDKVTKSISATSNAQKDWPRKCFQIDKNEHYESAMMCWESLEDSEQESKKRKTIGRDKKNNVKEKQDDKMGNEEHIRHAVYTGN